MYFSSLFRIVLFLCFLSLLNCRKVLIVAGNFSFGGALANIAEYDCESETWLQNYEPGLYLYGASNGVIMDIATNQSTPGHDRAFLVGAFDSDAQTSQVAYCSVGEWSGYGFSKVGEGLCPRGVDSSTSTSIRSIVLASDGSLMVGGTFHARVWDGYVNSFVDVYNLAVFTDSNGWLPLVGNMQLNCLSSANCVAGVYSLAWDASSGVLYIGGIFDSLNSSPITPSICQWTAEGGIKPFGGGGLTNRPNNSVYTQVVSIAFEEISQSVIIAGSFCYAGNLPCQNIALWNRRTGKWSCLYQASVSFAVISAMHLDPTSMDLFAAGWASDKSSWGGSSWGCPYAAAVTNINKLLNGHRYTAVGILGGHNKSKITTKSKRALSGGQQAVSLFSWDWLKGFPGGNGPIFKFLPLPETDSVIIGGAFNNFPSVVIWFRSNSTVRPLNDGSILSGDVAALALVIAALFVFQAYSYASLYASFAQMEIEPAASRRKKNSNNSSFGISRLFFALSAAVILFAVMGIAFLVGFKTKIEYESIMNEADTNEDNDYAVDIDLTSISLDALTGGIKSKIDIEICFENAMRSRHVKFRESLRSINSNLINLTRIIGEGSYGRVWAGRWRNEPVAVKEFVFAQTALLGGSLQTSELIEEIIGEAGIMSLLRHPKILQLYGVSLTTQTIWIISELCSCGSLRMILSNKRMELSFMTRLSIALDIAEGLNYLHTRRPQIIHRDLKSHNIFIHEASPGLYTAKIGDWGSARAIAISGGMNSMTQGVGTTCWLAPEVIEHAHCSMASDVYAFGIILWEIVTRQEVFVGLTANQIIARVVKSGLRPVPPDDSPLCTLMQSCWAQNPAERPNFAEIIASISRCYNEEVVRLPDDYKPTTSNSSQSL